MGFKLPTTKAIILSQIIAIPLAATAFYDYYAEMHTMGPLPAYNKLEFIWLLVASYPWMLLTAFPILPNWLYILVGYFGQTILVLLAAHTKHAQRRTLKVIMRYLLFYTTLCLIATFVFFAFCSIKYHTISPTSIIRHLAEE